MADDKDWIRTQKNAFTRWANTFLHKRELEIDDLRDDLYDGILLNNLLELISDKTVGRYNRSPRIRIQRLNNLNIGLNFIKREKLRMVNIGAEDIEGGNLKIILGLMWTLILRYQIASIPEQAPDSPVVEVQENSVKSALLAWFNHQIMPYNEMGIGPVRNFGTALSDGRALCALVDSLSPGAVDVTSLSGPLDNCELAINTADETYSIARIIDAEDIVNNPDEHAMMTYISFFQRFQQTGKIALRNKKVEVVIAEPPPQVEPEPEPLVVDLGFLDWQPPPQAEVQEEEEPVMVMEGAWLLDMEADRDRLRQLEIEEENRRQLELLEEEEKDEMREMMDDMLLARIEGYRMAPADLTKQKYQFTVGCDALIKTKLISKSDPMVGLFEKTAEGHKLVDFTEWLQDDHDPVFQKPLVVYYDKLKDQHREFRLVVWNVEGDKKDPKKKPIVTDKDMIGYGDVFLSRVLEAAADIKGSSQGVVKTLLRSDDKKRETKLLAKKATVNLSLRGIGLRQAKIVGAVNVSQHKGDKVDIRVELNGHKHSNPMVALFQKHRAQGGHDSYQLVGQTEWVKKPRRKVNFAKHVSVYGDTAAVLDHSYDKWFRLCLYEVPSQDKKEMRQKGRVVVPIDEKDMIGYRDFTFAELLHSNFGLSYPFFGAGNKQGRGTFILRSFTIPEVSEITVMDVLHSEEADHFGHEVQLSVRGHNFYKMDIATPADPFVCLFEEKRNGDHILIGQTEWQKGELHPVFKTKVDFYNSLREEKKLRFNVYDVDLKTWEDAKDFDRRLVKPIVRASDGDLIADPSLMGVAVVNLQELLINSALGEDVRVELQFPVANAENQINRRASSGGEVAAEWWRSKRIMDKKAAITVSMKVFHAHPQDPADVKSLRTERLFAKEIVPRGMPVLIKGPKRKAIDEVGHELIMKISCADLPKFDWGSLSDPMVGVFEKVLKVQQPQGPNWACPTCTFSNPLLFLACDVCGQQKPPHLDVVDDSAKKVVVAHEWVLIAQTEWVTDTSNPELKKSVTLHYDPEAADTHLRFVVYDVDNVDVTEQDMMGFTTTTLHNLVDCADGRTEELRLIHVNENLDQELKERDSRLQLQCSLEMAVSDTGRELGAQSKRREQEEQLRVGQEVDVSSMAKTNLMANPPTVPQSIKEELCIRVGLRNLIKMEWYSKSDPVVLLTQLNQETGNYDTLVAATEWKKDDHDAVFDRLLVVPKWEGVDLHYRLKVYDVTTPVLLPTDFVAHADITLSQLLNIATSADPLSKGRRGKLALEHVRWGIKLKLTHDRRALREMLSRKNTALFLAAHTQPRGGQVKDVLGLADFF